MTSKMKTIKWIQTSEYTNSSLAKHVYPEQELFQFTDWYKYQASGLTMSTHIYSYQWE